MKTSIGDDDTPGSEQTRLRAQRIILDSIKAAFGMRSLAIAFVCWTQPIGYLLRPILQFWTRRRNALSRRTTKRQLTNLSANVRFQMKAHAK